jgi:hypothetical protein
MATSKTKKNDGPVKTPRVVSKRKVVKKAVENQKPSEEQIRQKAEEIYYQRTERGESGSALTDWLAAEAMLSE